MANEITVISEWNNKGSINIDFGIQVGDATAGTLDRLNVSVSRERKYGGPYATATVNWAGMGSRSAEVAQAYAKLIAHASAHANLLNHLTDEALDALGEAAERAEQARWDAAEAAKPS